MARWATTADENVARRARLALRWLAREGREETGAARP